MPGSKGKEKEEEGEIRTGNVSPEGRGGCR